MKANGQPQSLPHSEECERAVLAAFNVASVQGRPTAVDDLPSRTPDPSQELGGESKR